MKRMIVASALGGLVMMAAIPAQAQTKVGVLRCSVAPGVGFLIGSSRRLTCEFRSADRKFVDNYTGRVNRVGIDIGVAGRSVILWQVIAPTSAAKRRGALQGRFVGVTGQAALGIGAGANVLVGGNNNTVSLQPLSVSGNTGINIAAGIGSITLTSVD